MMATVRFISVAVIVLVVLAEQYDCCGNRQSVSRIYIHPEPGNTAITCRVQFQSGENFTVCSGGCASQVYHSAKVSIGTTGNTLSSIDDDTAFDTCKGQVNCCVGTTTDTYNGAQDHTLFTTYCFGTGNVASYSDLSTRLRVTKPSACSCKECHTSSTSPNEVTSDKSIGADYCRP